MLNTKNDLDDLLVDTWWYALSIRMSKNDFENLAHIRIKQGFSAIQLVVGVPPEIGPENENANSIFGAPWDLNGNLNDMYLDLAFDRIKFLNDVGLTVIIYGAWGQQIKWLGEKKMIEWWGKIVDKMDNLKVVYCLTGEVDLLIGEELLLLPDKTSFDLNRNKILYRFPKKILVLFLKIVYKIGLRKIKISMFYKKKYLMRRKEWSSVLGFLAKKTTKPLIVHTTIETGYNSVDNPELLSANTVQTGHSQESKDRLWKWPIEILQTSTRYINLEPWYEGICDNFKENDQLFAYWVSMLSGATSYCYGAHGIWNVGDGVFLSHWGKQSFGEAINLDTPRLIGLSHKQFLKKKNQLFKTICTVNNGKLISIARIGCNDKIIFFPDISIAQIIPSGAIWLPLKGEFVEILPKNGQVVVFSKLN